MKASYTTYLTLILTLTILTAVNISLAQPMVDVTLKTQKDFYRPGDDFQLSASLFNPGEARIANVYMWVSGPDLVSYYMPDWDDMKHPWFYNLSIDAGTLMPTTVVFETKLPDHSFPVWIPGNYQIFMQFVQAGTDVPLAPAAMAMFTVKRGLVELLNDQTNYVLDVEAYGEEIWTAGPGGVVKWWKEGDVWDYESYSRLDGLSDTYIIEMNRDQFGNLMMWPYVGYGITVYDGYSFTNFFMDQKLYVAGVVTDRDMNIWAVAASGVFLGTRNGELKWCGEEDGLPESCTGVRIALDTNGYPVAVVEDDETDELLLCRYDGQVWWTIPFPFDWVDENGEDMYVYVRSLAVDPRGHVWIGTFYGALEYDGSTIIRHTSENSGLAGDYITKMKLDSLGRLWFACYSDIPGYGGLCFYDGENFGTMPGLDYSNVTGLAITFDGTLGVGMTDGLCILEPSGLSTFHQTEGPGIGMSVSDIAWGSDGTMYLADGMKGLWSYCLGLWSLMTTENGLAADSATCVKFDSQGVGWIGSRAGVTRWEGDTFTTFTVDDGLATNAVTRLAVDALDHPWVIGGWYKIVGGQYTLDYRLSHFDGSQWFDHSTDEGVPGLPMKVDCDTHGWVWVIEYSYELGGYILHSYDGQNWRLWETDDGFFEPGLCHSWVYCDSEGNVFASGEVTVGDEIEYRLAVFDGSTWTQYPLSDDPPYNATSDAAGRLWLAVGGGYSFGGLRIWDDGEVRGVLSVENCGVADGSCTVLAASPEGDMYSMNLPGLECHYLNPNVVAVTNSATYAPGETFTLKCWGENPGGADREVDLWLTITMPSGTVAYWPALDPTPAPALTVTLPAETALGPVELFGFSIPDTLPVGEYTITPWVCDHGSIDQTGQNTPAKVTIVSTPG